MDASSGKIRAANGQFKRGGYKAALNLYLQAISESPALKDALAYNIEFCQRRINREVEKTVPKTSLTSISVAPLIEQIDHPVHKLLNAALPNNKSLKGLLDSIATQKPTEHMLVSVLACLRSSPFQRDLLWYAGALLKLFGVVLPTRVVSGSESIKLLDLVCMASQSSVWLRNRAVYARYLEVHNVIDPRAWDLYNHAPAALGYSHTHLPEYREPNPNEYGWLKRCGAATKHHQPLAITLATILLNERKFIGLNLMQHYDLCAEWVLVEGACQGYPTRKVTEKGLSLDDSSAQIRLFPDPKGKIHFVQHGWTTCNGEDAKSELRNRYLEKLNTDLLVVLDADEFYLPADFAYAVSCFKDDSLYALTLPQVHFWKDTGNFITGEYYDISHTRIYRNIPGMRYIRNHNFPEVGVKFLQEYGAMKISRTIEKVSNESCRYKEPCCYHMGFAKDYDDMRDKTDYYINRGEMITRKSTSMSRAAWFDDALPEKCQVRLWGGEIPEALIGLGENKQ
jgi:hypothetical protein